MPVPHSRLIDPSLSAPLYRIETRSTADLDPRNRFDAWRAAAYGAVDLLPPPEGRDDIEASKTTIRGAWGMFGSHVASDHRTRLSRRASRDIPRQTLILSMMVRGALRLTREDGASHLAPRGSLAAYDVSRPMDYRWNAGKELYLVLPHAQAAELFRRYPGALSVPLDGHPITPFLKSQMRLLDRRADTLSPPQTASVLDAAIDMAMGLLSDLVATGADAEVLRGPGLRAAGLRHIAANAHRPLLNADTIARELGCSRATLYRAFQAGGPTLMDALRETRLARAHEMIGKDDGRGIAAIARSCGFTDPAHFSRSFRRQHGMLPSEWQALSRAGRAIG